jgi:hypothetical protein
MQIDCPICNLKNIDKKHPYSSHKIKYASFIEKYYPRFDLLTKEPIKFKSEDSYELTDFNDKRNLKKYLELATKEDGLSYLKNWVSRRKESKSLIYSPSEFECKSFCFPTIKFLHKFYGKDSYKKICEEAGLINRYDYSQILELEEKELNFIIDTRENSVLDLPNKIIQKLDVGDYTIENSDIIIEKKSISDFCGTLSKGFDRFARELDRCKKNNQYLIILIEEKFSNITSLAYLPHTKKIRATSDFILHRAREILRLYPEICQIVCVNNKKEAANLIQQIFSLKNDPKTIDFQYVLDSEKIILK